MKNFLACTVFVLSYTFANAEEIKVAADPWCPYTCESNSKQKGFMIEVLEKAFSTKGHKLNYQNLSWTKAIADTKAGKIHGSVGAAENEQGLLTNKNSFLETRMCYFVNESDSWKFESIASLENKTLGTIKDYSYGVEALDTYIQKNGTNSKKVDIAIAGSVDPIEANFNKLNANRIQVYVDDENVVAYFLSKNPKFKVKKAGCHEPSGLFVGFSGTNPESKKWIQDLDLAISEMKKSGEFQKIKSSYGL